MEYATEFFAALADPTRLRIIALLAERGEMCVCDLTAVLGINQPRVSRHMATLRAAGLVQDRRDAQWVRYSLSPCLPTWAQQAVAAAVQAVRQEAPPGENPRRRRQLTPGAAAKHPL